MPLKSNESRVTRRDASGVLLQWSNSTEVPEGSGWQQASKASFPRVRTYLWFRPATAIEQDRKNAEQAKAYADSRSPIEQLSTMAFRPFHYMKQKYDEMLAKRGVEHFKPNSRVSFNNQAYYTVGGVNDADQTIKIKNPVTGEIKSVNAKELIANTTNPATYAVGDRVVLAKGSIDSTKEHEAMVMGFDPLKGVYMVSLSAIDPKQRDVKDSIPVYPEAIDAFVPNQKPGNSAIQLKADALSDMGDRYVIEALYRAHRSGRNSVQLKEILADLRAHGHAVSEHQAVYTLATINRVDPKIQYNSNSGGVYIGAAEDSLKQLVRIRNITPEEGKFGLTNITQDSKTDTYAHAGISVKSDTLTGIIDNIVGDLATIISGGDDGKKKYTTVKVDSLKDQYNRTLHIDPAAPRTVGNVRNKDIFWVLRDREGTKSIKEGDSVALLPGVSNLRANKDKPLSGRVLAVNNDGTVDMLAQVGNQETRLRAFHRQLETTPQLKSMQELRDYLFMHSKAMPGKTVKVNNTEVVFGNNKDKSITLNFENGEDYAATEHHWFAPIAAGANPSGWESVINGLGSLWGEPRNFASTLAPTQALLGYINEVYPDSRYITIARDTTTTPEQIGGVKSKIKFKVVIDKDVVDVKSSPGRANVIIRGKRFELGRLYEMLSKPTNAAPIPATAIGDTNTVKITTDGESMFIKLGKLFKDQRASHLPPIQLYDTEVEALSAKQKAKYEETKDLRATFHDVMDASMFNRKRAWGAEPDGEKLANQSGVFTYDEENDRYIVGLEHYDDAHAFLKRFFGDMAYDGNIYETYDRGYYAYARNKLLQSEATKYQKVLEEHKAAKDDTEPLKIEGFYQNSKNVILRPYQNAAVHFMLKNNSSLLAMDQGTGKSVSAIAAVTEKLNRMNAAVPGKKHRALIIAPAAVAQTSWMNDLNLSLVPKGAKGTVLPGKHNYSLLMGPGRTEGYKRLADNNDNTSIGVTSYHTFAMQDWLELKNLGFDMVVIDEAQAMSGDEQTKGIITERLQLMLNDVMHKIALTGTPLENKPEDLQAILSWLKPETFGDAKQFMNDFVDVDYKATPDASGRMIPRKMGVRIKNLKALRSKLDQIMFRVEKEDLISSKYNEPAKGLTGTTAIPFDEDHKVFDKYVAEYKSLEPGDPRKEQIGELSVVPMRLVYPLFGKDKDGNTQPFVTNKDTKRIHLNFDPGYNPLTTDAYPEYKAAILKAKALMRAEYIKAMQEGKRTGTQTYLLRMQQVMNDPSLLNAKYPGEGFNTYVPNPKVDRMFNIVANHFSKNRFDRNDNGKIIIFAEHVETIKFLEKRLTEQFPQLKGRFLKYIGSGHTGVTNGAEFKTRQNIQDAFNKDPDFHYPIMLANNAAKTGVNLPAANMVINYDIGWNPQDINQRIDRAHRIRSLKDIVASNTAPARNVTAHNLVVSDASGDINSSVEARKMFVHKVKERIFNTFIRGKEKPDEGGAVKIPQIGDQQMTEELLDVTDAQLKLQRTARTDPERARKQVQGRADERKRAELIKQYGPYAKYFREFPREQK